MRACRFSPSTTRSRSSPTRCYRTRPQAHGRSPGTSTSSWRPEAERAGRLLRTPAPGGDRLARPPAATARPAAVGACPPSSPPGSLADRRPQGARAADDGQAKLACARGERELRPRSWPECVVVVGGDHGQADPVAGAEHVVVRLQVPAHRVALPRLHGLRAADPVAVLRVEPAARDHPSCRGHSRRAPR